MVSQEMATRTGSLSCFLSLFFLLSSPQRGKIGKGQWEGATVSSSASPERKLSQQAVGSRSVTQEHWGICLDLPEGLQSPQHLTCLGRSPRPHPALCSASKACRLAPPNSPLQQEEKEGGPREEGTGEAR